MSFEMHSKPIGYKDREIASVKKKLFSKEFNWQLSKFDIKILALHLRWSIERCPCKGQNCIHCEETARYITALTWNTIRQEANS